ncbi:MAG TPA: AarF/ABC1/UbiB kinase family protein [Hyphomicrobiales bacterium]|nr:AarF/ABC1/UbiB kinase family protein [Hyphomicrobiales bacterium]
MTEDDDPTDRERNRLSARAVRYARVGAGMGGVAARLAGARLAGAGRDRGREGEMLAAALGGLKGPLMKVAQLLSTIPDALPAEYASALATLQSNAPPMGPAFVRRRMMAELGPDWRSRFAAFDPTPAAAASLGQVHRAESLDGRKLAVKLQYPDMRSAVEADLAQLRIIMGVQRRMDPSIDTSEILKEIGARVREELDYRREARHAALYATMLAGEPMVRIPGTWPELSTGRLLTLDWLDGQPILAFKAAAPEVRNRLATAMFRAWWHPFAHDGVIHGDPHLGNYTVFVEAGAAAGINLLDYGCVRIFPARFVAGVVALYEGLLHDDREKIVGAYESWGFRGLSQALIDTLNVWARFIYGPMLSDRVRTLADGTRPGEYGRREAFRVHQALRQHGPVTVPREFVFMDRAAVGLGSVFLHLGAELNFHRLFEAEIAGFAEAEVAARQAAALAAAGLAPPSTEE